MSQNPNVHTFDLTTIINPETKEPFGPRYAGNFTVRRPTLKDNASVSLAFAAATSAAGPMAHPAILTSNSINQMYVFCLITVIASEKPDWFKSEGLYEEDQVAVEAVHEEVDRWVSTFRPKQPVQGSGKGSKDPTVLVP